MRTSYETLKMENALYAEAVLVMPNPVLLLNADNKVCIMNDAAHALLQGIDAAADYSMLDKEHNYHIDKILPEIHAQLLDFLENGAKARTISLEIVRPGGRHILLANYYRLYGQEVHVGTAIILAIVTDQNEIEAKLDT